MINRPPITPFFVLLILLSCNTGPADDPIPTVFFNDIIIDLDDPEYVDLHYNGGYVELTDHNGGVRGIILYRYDQDTYFSYERNCSYKPNDACATVNVHPSGIFMEDPCCSSTFSFSTGLPTSGPAWRPLIRYRTRLQASQLIIQDQVLR